MSTVIAMPEPRRSLVPTMSTGLRMLIERSKPSTYGSRSSDDAGLKIAAAVRPTSNQVDEARRVLPEWERALEPVPRHQLRQWLIGLNASVGNMLDSDMFNIRFEAIYTDVANFPEAAFSPESLSAAKRRCEFFPSVAKLFEIIEPFRRDLEHNVSVLRRVSQPPVQRAQNPEYIRPPPEQREAILAEFRASMAKARAEAARAISEATPARAEPKLKMGMSDRALLETFRCQLAREPSSLNADTLRRRIALLEGKLVVSEAAARNDETPR